MSAYPPGMSAAAREFIAAASCQRKLPLAPQNLEQLRADARAAFIPAGERAVAHHDVTVNDITVGGVSCLEVLPPQIAGDHCILYFYGGGYFSGSAREDLVLSAALAGLTGRRLVAVQYSLAPEYPYPVAMDQALEVYQTLVDQSPLVVAGESAGGNLALVTLLNARQVGLGLPDATLLLSPWCDLRHQGDSLNANDGQDPSLDRAYVEAAAALYGGDPDHWSVSPILGAFDATFPPTMITTGTRDLLLSQCVNLDRTLRHAGIDVTLRLWDGLWHVFEFYDQLPEAGQSLAECGAFLNAAMALR